ncbi:MAG: ABC transporter permease [Planctomycetes bacterium]|nr:ABC transporter permease [Planctomycetota bacterium]
MDLPTLLRRNLHFHWRTNLTVVLGVIAGTAALTGALLVGDSMRGSLRAAAVGRLGRVECALASQRFFRTALANEVPAPGVDVHPAILLRGGAAHADSRARVNRINLLGIDQRFWQLSHTAISSPPATSRPDTVLLNQHLADELGAQPGDDVLLSVGKPRVIPTETLLGRRDEMTTMLRLTVAGVIPAEGLGAFSLTPQQAVPANAYVPLPVLQRALRQTERVNALLFAARGTADDESSALDAPTLQTAVQQTVRLADLSLRVRVDHAHGYLALESEAFLLEPAFEAAARSAADALGLPAAGVLTYLANTIATAAADEPERTIPYSTVAALGPAFGRVSRLPLLDGAAAPELSDDEILLNEWAANDLNARPGDRVRLSYFITAPFGQLETRESSFVLRGVVRLDAAAADPGFTPDYPGLTDTGSLADWDPPFPVDLGRVRDRDETYWDQYRATPKAFIALSRGQDLWTASASRFGRITSLRLHPAQSDGLAPTAESFGREFLRQLDVQRAGLKVDPVRQRLTEASRGTTDFAGMFIGFSFFLIVSAGLLVALLFRLAVERRAHELGLLLATGCQPTHVTRLLLLEGLVLANLGALLGLLFAVGYAWLMLAGLRTWWAGAVNAPFLRVHVSCSSFVVGYFVSLAVAMLSLRWGIRGLARRSPRALLAGVTPVDPAPVGIRRQRRALAVAALALIAGLLLAGVAAGSDALSATVAFFGSGAALLIACLALLVSWLRSRPGSLIQRPGLWALLRLGVRNAPRHPGRSFSTAALIASATFVIAALQAMRLDVATAPDSRSSGTGGFALLAESTTPLPYDLNTPAGRAALDLPDTTLELLDDVTVHALRLQPGDETSCLMLYQPTKPRIVGAGNALVQRGGFAFSATLAATEQERDNPWTLLSRETTDGTIPAIADEAAVRWQLHLGLGQDLVVTDEEGRPARLHFVGLLKGSVLQGEVIISEEHFARLFPSAGGHAYFLLDVSPKKAAAVARALERDLSDYGFDVTDTSTRLTRLFAVQNTYLSTFQALGGLGLLLGTLGLAAVLLRNVWERRGELALLRALGFSRVALGVIVLVENAVLVSVGLGTGLLSALLAIAPHLTARPGSLPWGSLGLILAAVFMVGMTSGVVALVPALRARLLPALQRE